MKPIASKMTEIDNIEGEEIAFGISAANAGWVMRSMADLYSNRELAVIREYSTNARDAMIEAGNGSEPIEIGLPSAMHPYFEVRDYGIGMSEQTLREVYTQFGESSKRDSDDFNGMLGFGSKSAVAYTNTFTIEAVKDGIKTIGIITRKEDFRITLKIVVSGVETNERNGVKIQVPVHNHSVFCGVANDFYKYWLPGTVLVNGKTPKWAAGDKIDEGLYYSGSGTSFVVMGNVAYRINNPRALFPNDINGFDFVAYVENGTVEFVPSREDLKYSEHTKAALHKIIADLIARALANAKTEVAASKTHYQAFEVWSKWRQIIGTKVDDLTFKGDKLVHHINVEGWRYDMTTSRYTTSHGTKMNIGGSLNTIIITSFPSTDRPTTEQRRKAREWAKIKHPNATRSIFTADATVASPWFDPARVVQWETVKNEAPKLVRPPKVKSTAPGRLAGTFDLVDRKGRHSEKDVPIVKELFYMMVQEYNKAENLGMVLNSFNIDHQVVLIPANRYDKFMRNYAHAKPIMPVLESMVKFDGNALISADGHTFMSMEDADARMLSNMDESKIDDPEVVRLIKIVKVGRQKYMEDYSRQEYLSRLIGKGSLFKQHKYRGYGKQGGQPVTKVYPLVSGVNWYRNQDTLARQHVYEYMNAIYKSNKERKERTKNV